MAELAPRTWQFFLSPASAWEAMSADCAAAQTSIECEQYILEVDRVGQAFEHVWIARARHGVRVALLLDRIGSWRRVLDEGKNDAPLHAAGVRVHYFNSWRWAYLFHLQKFLPRTHAKTMLIDGQIGYVGGVCFDATMAGWRDTQMRFTGAAAVALQEEFVHYGTPSPATVCPRCRGTILRLFR